MKQIEFFIVPHPRGTVRVDVYKKNGSYEAHAKFKDVATAQASGNDKHFAVLQALHELAKFLNKYKGS
ncbi:MULTISPECIES: hypothetical protein [Anoxybacillus]|uniref:Uncharacterized protein n=2 Tax=Anoxybacillus TaxID=150247 RepID=A0A0D0HRE0_9BACL|nr:MULTISPECIES: hypothetical protein [Anoxybacillus]KHF28127.1 hypothetical protein LR68_03064 [Anoxybacillus sp. BCO1]EPZ39312.1 hypothetical protein C289_0510 [Anoxybacillus ayderensis]KIP20383.1 hypothetical protein JV16_02431 [Anoxybacillus ayderensis]KIQ94142.1 hypothetical protein LH47_01760 [Anoxybacillus thermarum]MBA2878156.1 ribosome-associated translation inhibitor RaiA [Anoxybacillus ayderensis]